VVAGLQATEALKILTGRLEDVNRHLVSVDVWSGRFASVNVAGADVRTNCPCCRQHRYAFLSGERFSTASHLCGRDAVQVNRKGDHAVDLAGLADRLRPVARGEVRVNAFLLKAAVDAYELTVFSDGRAIIQGTDSPNVARSVYARYVGV
jgi:adenylyltransferase/sulfurtransferase